MTFTLETALAKVHSAEAAWNSKDPERIALAYSPDSQWRNRTTFLKGKWERELDYRLKKTLWGFRENRIAVSFEYEWHNEEGQWFRSYGNELWDFNDEGLMQTRFASINDVPIEKSERRIL